jgi:hypothetical protein
MFAGKRTTDSEEGNIMAGEWTYSGVQAEIAYRTEELRRAGRGTWTTKGRVSRRARKASAAPVEIPEQTRREVGRARKAAPAAQHATR